MSCTVCSPAADTLQALNGRPERVAPGPVSGARPTSCRASEDATSRRHPGGDGTGRPAAYARFSTCPRKATFRLARLVVAWRSQHPCRGFSDPLTHSIRVQARDRDHALICRISTVIVTARPSRIEAMKHALPGTSAPAAPIAAQRVVLVIDDQHDMAAAVAMLLDAVGYVTRIATTCTEALQHSRNAEPPLFIVCDFHLGTGRNGLELITEIRTHRGHTVPAILMTGDRSPAIREQADAMRDVQLLKKPFEAGELLALLAGDEG